MSMEGRPADREQKKPMEESSKLEVLPPNANFEDSILIKAQDGMVYAISEKEGKFKGVSTTFQEKFGTFGATQQLHDEDFAELEKNGVLDAYRKEKGKVPESGSMEAVSAEPDSLSLLLEVSKTQDLIAGNRGTPEDQERLSRARELINTMDAGAQEELAEKFFAETMLNNPSPSTAKEAYGVYKVFSNTGFSNKFRELEDARLKAAGFREGFIL